MQHVEDLERKLREAYDTIHWLEQEVQRLKLLLAGENVMMNSFGTQKK